jgi:Spy/CpxP family protein refolding chaperone
MKSIEIGNWKTGIATTLAILLVASTAMAFFPGGGKGGRMSGDFGRKGGQRSLLGIWQNTQAVEELGLSAEQVTRLKEADFASREKRLELSSRMDRLRLEMQKARATEPLDTKAVRKAAEKIADEMGAMFLHRTEAYLTAAGIFTPEQLEKVEQFRKQRGKRQRGQARGWRQQADRAFPGNAPAPRGTTQQ